MSDTYVYPGTTILINLNGIRKQKVLDEYENTFVNLALIKLLKDDYKVNSSMDIFRLHKQLFIEVYDWAGSPRTLNIYKEELVLNGLSVEYSNHTEIINDLNNLNSVIQKTKWNLLSKSALTIDLSSLISKLWRIHPFREGNTRTITTFLYFFLKKYGYTLNVEFLKEHAKFFRNALVMSSINEYSEYKHLENILNDSIESKKGSEKSAPRKSSNDRYKSIKGIDMENYSYNYHIVKE